MEEVGGNFNCVIELVGNYEHGIIVNNAVFHSRHQIADTYPLTLKLCPYTTTISMSIIIINKVTEK